MKNEVRRWIDTTVHMISHRNIIIHMVTKF